MLEEETSMQPCHKNLRTNEELARKQFYWIALEICLEQKKSQFLNDIFLFEHCQLLLGWQL
jgi:hypothetical protein